jgi:hypothetical protein
MPTLESARCTDLRPYTCIHVPTSVLALSVTIATATEQPAALWRLSDFAENAKLLRKTSLIAFTEEQVGGQKFLRDFAAVCRKRYPLVEFTTRALGQKARGEEASCSIPRWAAEHRCSSACIVRKPVLSVVADLVNSETSSHARTHPFLQSVRRTSSLQMA